MGQFMEHYDNQGLNPASKIMKRKSIHPTYTPPYHSLPPSCTLHPLKHCPHHVCFFRREALGILFSQGLVFGYCPLCHKVWVKGETGLEVGDGGRVVNYEILENSDISMEQVCI